MGLGGAAAAGGRSRTGVGGSGGRGGAWGQAPACGLTGDRVKGGQKEGDRAGRAERRSQGKRSRHGQRTGNQRESVRETAGGRPRDTDTEPPRGSRRRGQRDHEANRAADRDPTAVPQCTDLFKSVPKHGNRDFYVLKYADSCTSWEVGRPTRPELRRAVS